MNLLQICSADAARIDAHQHLVSWNQAFHPDSAATGTVSTRTSFTPRYTAARIVAGIVGKVTIGFALIFVVLIGSQQIASVPIRAVLMLPRSNAVRADRILALIAGVRIFASPPACRLRGPSSVNSLAILRSVL